MMLSPLSLTSSPSSRRRPAGFTLIELLTVIAIIGILAAILIPVVGKVRGQARSAQCGSNLRQIGMSMFLFAEANNDRFPGWHWQGQYFFNMLAPYADDQNLFFCPSDDEVDRRALADATLFELPPWEGIIIQSYAWNYLGAGRGESSTQPGQPDFVRPEDFMSTTRVLLLTDASDSTRFGFFDATGAYPSRTVHDGNVNGLFMDGHVESIPPETFLQPEPYMDRASLLLQ